MNCDLSQFTFLMCGVQGGDSVHTQVSGPPYSLPLKNPLNEPWQEIFLEILKCYLNGAGGSNSIAYRINLVGCPSSADFKKHRLRDSRKGDSKLFRGSLSPWWASP